MCRKIHHFSQQRETDLETAGILIIRKALSS